MDNVTITQPSAFMKHWLEKTLGFGNSFNIENATGLFQKIPKGKHYSQSNSNMLASVGAITTKEWDVIHSNETGFVLHDLTVDVLERARDYANRTLAQDGFAVETFVNDSKTMATIGLLINTITNVTKEYREHVNVKAVVKHTLTVRKMDREFRLVCRVLFESPEEQVYISITSPNVVGAVGLHVNSDQVASLVKFSKAALSCFNYHHGLFRQLNTIDINPRLVGHALNATTAMLTGAKFNVAEQTVGLYKAFRQEVLNNKALFVGVGENHSIYDHEQFNYLEELETLDQEALGVLVRVGNLLVTQIKSILEYNRPTPV